MTTLITTHQKGQAQHFIEDLNGILLDMILIPSGTFMMGSPETEEDRSPREGPQHQVTLPLFFMGRYPVTQAQWKEVATWDLVQTQLDPDPSRFKGLDRPVERISWYEAVEFCDRLTQRSGRPYRLPSEAEWEYACRSNTTTPFHFGETITTDLANYDGTGNEAYGWKGSYGRGPKGIHRKGTTPVGSFGVANAFGLYDMHGNVWEWCTDPWHKDYENSPKDGMIWEDGGDKKRRLLRGGSWFNYPRDCRSAYRIGNSPGYRLDYIGFRVCCSPPR